MDNGRLKLYIDQPRALPRMYALEQIDEQALTFYTPCEIMRVRVGIAAFRESFVRSATGGDDDALLSSPIGLTR